MHAPPDLTILIVCRGGELAPLSWGHLDALAPLVSGVIVVSAEAPRKWPMLRNLQVRFLTAPWGNRNRSRNTGLKAITTSWVYLLDEDVQAPTKSHLYEAMTYLSETPERLGLAGPYQDPPESSYWSRTYNLVSNAWARNGRFLAGHVILRTQNVEFAESLLNGGEEQQLLDDQPELRRNLVWLESFSALHHRKMSFMEFLRKGLGHGFARNHQENLRKKMRRTTGIPLISWPGVLIFQGAVEAGSLFKSKPPESSASRNLHIRETSSRNPSHDVDHIP